MSFFFFFKSLRSRVFVLYPHISATCVQLVKQKRERKKRVYSSFCNIAVRCSGAVAAAFSGVNELVPAFEPEKQKVRSHLFCSLLEDEQKKKKTAQESLQHERVRCGSTSFFLFFPIELDEVQGKC